MPLLPLHSPRAVRDIRELITRHDIDVLHLHNPYPLISMSVVTAAHSLGIPVVVTLHNHRHSCVRGSYFREGQLCVECRGKALPWPAVQHGCYRDSRLQSIPMAAALRLHRRDQHSVDRYVALTETMARSINEAGLARPDQVVVRPNSVRDPGSATSPGKGLLFVGRLTAEKGVPLLLQAWERAGRPFDTLTLIGEGPALEEISAAVLATDGRVRVLGRQDSDGVDAAMRSAAAVVVPSTAPEAMPLVVLEAFAHGRPVIATGGRGLGSLVTAEVGWLGDASVDGLALALASAAADDLELKGSAARVEYEKKYAPEVVAAAQMRIYRDVIDEHVRSRPGARGRGPRS